MNKHGVSVFRIQPTHNRLQNQFHISFRESTNKVVVGRIEEPLKKNNDFHCEFILII